MTIPVLRVVGTMGSYGGNNSTLAKPSGTVAGDVMLAFLSVDGPTTAWSGRIPAGWTLLAADAVSSSAFVFYPAVAIKVAGASEPSTYGFDFGSQAGCGVLISYSGVDGATPVDVSAQSINSASSTSFSLPSVTTSRTDSMLVEAYFNRQTNGVTHTPPSGMTQRVSARGAIANSNFGVADLGIAIAGATGVRSATSATSDISFGVTIALRSADGAAPGPVVTGTISLDAFTLSGAFATGALSLLTGDIPLDSFALSGFLGLAPGRIDSNPFKNWTGTLLAGITIPRLTFLKLSDMSTVLQLTNQTVGGSGVLTVTNAAFTPGTTYVVVAASVDGASLGAEIYTAT